MPYKGRFLSKKIDIDGQEFFKERYTLRGDRQNSGTYFDADKLYAPVASHESTQLFLLLTATVDLFLDRSDIIIAYLYGHPNYTIIMQQPTDSSQSAPRPDNFCLLKNLFLERD